MEDIGHMRALIPHRDEPYSITPFMGDRFKAPGRVGNLCRFADDPTQGKLAADSGSDNAAQSHCPVESHCQRSHKNQSFIV